MLHSLKRRTSRWIDQMRLSATARRIRAERLTYLPVRKLVRIESALAEVRRNNVPGDVMEFGVALGGSAILLAQAAGEGRRFFGLDVFAMIPPPTSEKDDAKSKDRYQIIAAGQATGFGDDPYYGYRDDLYEHVSAQLARFGTPVDGRRINLVKGLFEETLPTLDVGRIAFAHIDCDWYDPVRYCLHETARRLAPGGVIVIDDYNDYAGCRAAVDEFLAQNGDFDVEPGLNPILRRADSAQPRVH
jgi:asparagine synthase (glutamine-hydrolysing)